MDLKCDLWISLAGETEEGVTDNLNPDCLMRTCDSYDFSRQNTESLHKKNANTQNPSVVYTTNSSGPSFTILASVLSLGATEMLSVVGSS